MSAAASRSSVVLPAPFGPEDDPALVELDGPVDGVEQRRVTAADRHALHPYDEVTRVGHRRLTPHRRHRCGKQRFGRRSVCGHGAYPRRSCRSSRWVPMSSPTGSASRSRRPARRPSRCAWSTARSTARGELTERRVALTERTFGVWHGHVPGAVAGQRYGYRVHGPYRPWEGPRANPAKILVDPYARQITGGVTDIDAARGWTIDPMTGPPSEVDSLGHVPLSVVTAAPPPVTTAAAGRAVVRDRDRRGARPRLHEAAPGGAAGAARHLPRAGPSGGRRAPAAHRGDGRRAAPGDRHRDRAPAARTRPGELLGLLHARLLRPAPGLRGRRPARRSRSSGRWSTRCTRRASR